MSSAPRAEAVVDLDAVRANVARLRAVASGAQVLAVVKADGYGHGLLPVARAAREAGAQWLGVAVREEALALRAAGDTGPLLCWLAVPGEPYAELLDAGVDVTASSGWQLAEVVAAARARRRTGPAAAQGRHRPVPQRVPAGRLARPGRGDRGAQRDGTVQLTGVWSHFACADQPDHPANDAQQQVFEEALAVVARAGLEPEVRHLANSPATLTRPSAHYDLVRTGLAVYGLSPAPEVASAPELGLRPALTLGSRLAAVRSVPQGAGVSYGHTFVTPRPTTLGLVPLGYGDGIPRSASNVAQVQVGGARAPVVGAVCMDQFVVDLGPDSAAAPGDEVLLIGPGDAGEPTAQDWAEWTGTIAYEVVARLGGRINRRHTGARP